MPDQPYLIDIGANLTHESFDHDRDVVIKQADQLGVKQLIITGADSDSCKKSVEVSRAYTGKLFSTAGIHPHHATECNADTIPALRDLAQMPTNVAVGECGLDYFRDFSPRDTQRKWFEKQLELACDLNKPVFLHEREASDDFYPILKDFIQDLPQYVVHCFTGTEAELERYLDLGAHIGITGWICDERRGSHLHDFIDIIPDDKLMIETDAPYLLPRDIKPKPKNRRNIPAYLPHIAETVARIRRQNIDEIIGLTQQNSLHFFNIPILI